MKTSLITSLLLVLQFYSPASAARDPLAICYITCFLKYEECMHTCPLGRSTTYIERHQLCSEWRSDCYKKCRARNKALVVIDPKDR
ncbi:hypothetical protein NP493_1521g00013 [Ridgeia piscesae]|uniref:Uncharacterized protein n=1 Tax=Ridgeia piscesae TaxID=27915 RepID=A0AAD9K0T3_RIDPI|nr:hypothetical protein NP493_1521g00013 [Ridgeia piscesae]